MGSKNDVVLMIISSHDSQRIFTWASLITLSMPPALVHRVPIRSGGGIGKLSDIGRDQVRCVGSRSLWARGLLVMFYLRCDGPEEGKLISEGS